MNRSPRDQDVHVTPEKGEGKRWAVMYLGVTFVTATRQIDAVRYGRGLAVEKSCDLVVHGRDGKIRRKSSFGNDPRSRKG